MRRVLVVQLLLLAVCVGGLALWAMNFPYPSPTVESFLPPKKRWPTALVKEWVQSREFSDGFLEHFYRDPDVQVPDGENMVAPADGNILIVDKKDGMVFVVVGLTYWDVHTQRIPCDGVVKDVFDHGDTLQDYEGYNWVFLKDKTGPVSKVVILDTAWGDVRVQPITSLSARRVEVWVKKGQKVRKGERMGRILLGSTTVIAVPDRYEPLVKVGDRVTGGESIIFGKAASE